MRAWESSYLDLYQRRNSSEKPECRIEAVIRAIRVDEIEKKIQMLR